jgi:hypothetical protein
MALSVLSMAERAIGIYSVAVSEEGVPVLLLLLLLLTIRWQK